MRSDVRGGELQPRLLAPGANFQSSWLLAGRTPLLSWIRVVEQVVMLTPFPLGTTLGSTGRSLLDATLRKLLYAFLHCNFLASRKGSGTS